MSKELAINFEEVLELAQELEHEVIFDVYQNSTCFFVSSLGFADDIVLVGSHKNITNMLDDIITATTHGLQLLQHKSSHIF